MSKSLLTLKSALASHNINDLASVLAKMGGDKEGVQKFGRTFSLAVQKAKDLIKEQEAEKAANLKAAAEKRAETIAARQKAQAEEAEALKKERAVEAENMLKSLVDEMGLDLEVANEMVATAMLKKYPEKKETSFKFNRVQINYNGELYNMPTSGNMPDVWKERAGADRAAFILQYAVDAEQAAEILEQKNGVNV